MPANARTWMSGPARSGAGERSVSGTYGPAIEEYASGWAEGYPFALAVIGRVIAHG